MLVQAVVLLGTALHYLVINVLPIHTKEKLVGMALAQ